MRVRQTQIPLLQLCTIDPWQWLEKLLNCFCVDTVWGNLLLSLCVPFSCRESFHVDEVKNTPTPLSQSYILHT